MKPSVPKYSNFISLFYSKGHSFSIRKINFCLVILVDLCMQAVSVCMHAVASCMHAVSFCMHAISISMHAKTFSSMQHACCMHAQFRRERLNTETKKLLHNEVHKLLLIVTRIFICKSQCCISIHFSAKFIALYFIKIGHYICLKDTVVQALCTLFHFL